MNKKSKTIKLTEQDLHWLVKESVKRTLKKKFKRLIDPEFRKKDDEINASWDEYDDQAEELRQYYGSSAEDIFNGNYTANDDPRNDYYRNSSILNTKDVWNGKDLQGEFFEDPRKIRMRDIDRIYRENE